VDGVNKTRLSIDGSVSVLEGGSIVTTNAAGNNDGTFTAVGDVSNGSLIVQGGNQALNRLYVGVGPGSHGTLTIAGGTTTPSVLMCAGCRVNSTGTVWMTGGQLVQTDNPIMLGGDVGAGQMTVSNGTVLAYGVSLGVFSNTSTGAKGTLTIAGGSIQVVSNFVAGWEHSTSGTVWMTGGELTVTNGGLYLGAEGGFGRMIISNGMVTAQQAYVGNSKGLRGSLTITGGELHVISNMLVGFCSIAATGSVVIAGGDVFVANSNGTAVLDLSGGTLTLSAGLLIVDKFVITNTCARFVYTGGTLLYSDSILSAGLDADGDGLTNSWEVQYGLGPLNPFGHDGASGDPDGDGLSNLEESQLGTDPTDPYSPFRITDIRRVTNDVRVTWTATRGKTNFLQAA